MAYNKTTWVNNQAPALDADHLNHIEQGIKDAHDGLDEKADAADIPTKVSDLTNDAGYTSNTGTITGITMNGASKGTSGNVDLGTVLTQHQDISGKQDTLVSGTNIKTINGSSVLGPGNIVIEGGGGGGSENIAAEYSASSTYAVGDYCIYDGQLYRCTTAITTAEAWTAAHWTMTTVGEEITDVKGDITQAVSTKQDALVSGTNIKTINNTSLLGSGNIDIIAGDYVTPEMYGAVGDGVADDTIAIQSAINSGSAKVLFSNATYRVSGKIGLKSNLRLVGVTGAKLVWDTFSGGTALMSGQLLHDIEIENISFDFGTQNELRISFSLIESYNIVIKDCIFTHGYGYAVRINNDYNVLFEGCAFNSITGGAGNPGGGIFGMDFHDVTFRRCNGDTIDDHLVYIAGATECYNVRVEDCTCYKSGQNNLTNGAAICVYANSHNIVITGNILRLCSMGIFVGKYGDYTTVPYDITISNNVITNASSNAIHLEGLTSAYIARANISNNTIDYCSQDGIKMILCNQTICDSNIVAYPTRIGISLDRVIYSTFSNCIVSEVVNTAVQVGTREYACLYCKFDNLILTQKNGTYNSIGIYSRGANYCEYINVKALGFATNYIYSGGALNSWVNSQEIEATKSLYFTTDITRADYHNVGDVVIAANPTAGQPAMWICTVAGAPGTMTPLATI